eukprot:scaffold2256_cov131-Skeletonema_marinoi.AAC.2
MRIRAFLVSRRSSLTYAIYSRLHTTRGAIVTSTIAHVLMIVFENRPAPFPDLRSYAVDEHHHHDAVATLRWAVSKCRAKFKKKKRRMKASSPESFEFRKYSSSYGGT